MNSQTANRPCGMPTGAVKLSLTYGKGKGVMKEGRMAQPSVGGSHSCVRRAMWE